MSEKFKKGEIATVLTIGAFIFLSAATLISTVFLKDQKQTTTSKAADSGYFGVCVPAPPISQDTQYTPTGYRWKADCSRSCTDSSQCPKNTTSPNQAVNPETSNWCYGFSDGMKCMMLEYIPGAYVPPNFTCPDGGKAVKEGFCEYGWEAIHSPYYVEQVSDEFRQANPNDEKVIRCNSCVIVNYSDSFPHGECKYNNNQVCRRHDAPVGGCAGLCNWNCCNRSNVVKMSQQDYDAYNRPGSSGLSEGGGQLPQPVPTATTAPSIATNTPAPTATPAPTITPGGPTLTPTMTPTITATPTATPTPVPGVINTPTPTPTKIPAQDRVSKKVVIQLDNKLPFGVYAFICEKDYGNIFDCSNAEIKFIAELEVELSYNIPTGFIDNYACFISYTVSICYPIRVAPK